MLSLSPSVSLRQGSPASKRDKPHDYDPPKQTSRPKGPFVDDDDDDDSDEENKDPSGEPLVKKRMIQRTSEEREAPRQATIQNPFRSQKDAGTQDDASTVGGELQGLPLLFERPSTTFCLETNAGKRIVVKERKTGPVTSYESMVASRTKTKEGRAKRGYYGVDIHNLIDTANKEISDRRSKQVPDQEMTEAPRDEAAPHSKKSKKTLLWTEKYRARNFMDLCGDDGTNRQVLRWLKKWDPIVFPGAAKSKPVIPRRPGFGQQQEEEKPHKKILMLTGPPGLGKTTLAHVCARQAGYDVMEINASDDRSKDVVKNRIRTSLGTESVRVVPKHKTGEVSVKAARPACVIVDEVDGVVTGAGGSGEGGFVSALIDLVHLDQKNSSQVGSAEMTGASAQKKKKGDDFRLLRPLVLICNDVYAPALRPLRQSGLAEIIHVGRPTIDAVVGRLRAVFEKEGLPCDKDAARKLCEAAWGMSSGIDAKRGAESTVEGDLRGVMVVGEWVAGRFKASAKLPGERLTKQWVERNVLGDVSDGASGARGLGRGNSKDIVSRLFQEGGGFPKQAMDLAQAKNQHEQPTAELGFGEQQKKYAMQRLQHMTETSGEISHILTEVFAEYPNREYNDDLYLTKPNQAYDWLYFHDACQARLYTSQDWELAPYLSQPVLACHHLFASPKRHYEPEKKWGAAGEQEEAPLPFTGPRADWQAREAEKHNRAQLQAVQAKLSPSLGRSFRSPEDVAAEFLPWLVRIVSPDVKPVVVGGSQGSTASVRKESEKAMVKRAADVLADVRVQLRKGKIESEVNTRGPQFVYRMEPDLDALSAYETASNLLSSQAPTRYAVRQVIDQELQKTILALEARARQARFLAGGDPTSSAPLPVIESKGSALQLDDVKTATAIKRDFFGRVVEARPLAELVDKDADRVRAEQTKVWVTYHEGLNNAVRKPMSYQEFMRGM